MLLELKRSVAVRKAELDALRPLAATALRHLQKAWDVELTYTSNAIEGNTLTLRETAEVIEHGITVGGRTLKEHLEAADHHAALLWMRHFADATTPVGELVVKGCTAASSRAASRRSPASTASIGGVWLGRRWYSPATATAAPRGC